MSDAREKALAAYQATFPEGCVGTATIRDDFTAGWDAAKADLPSREALFNIIQPWADGNSTPDEFSDACYEPVDQILALLRGGE